MQTVCNTYWDAGKGNMTAQNTRKPFGGRGNAPDPAEGAYSAPANPLGLAFPPKNRIPCSRPFGPRLSYPHSKISFDAIAGNCSLNCCVRICPCVKKRITFLLLSRRVYKCCNSNCVCHLDAVWQTLLNKNCQWSDKFTFIHNRLCGVFNDERYQAMMKLFRTNHSSDCCAANGWRTFCSSQRMSLSSWVKQYSRLPFDFSASFQSKHRMLSNIVKMESSNEWCTIASQSYDYDAQAQTSWCKFICQIVTLKST